MTDDEKARIVALQSRTDLSSDEQAELDRLKTQEAQEFEASMPGTVPPEPAAPPPPVAGAPELIHGLTAEDRAKLAWLRLKAVRSDDETAEMEKMSLAESEAAGHVAPPALDAPSDDQAVRGFGILAEIMAALRHLRDVIPAAAGLSSFINRAEQYFPPPPAPVGDSPYHDDDAHLTAQDHSPDEHHSV